MKNNRLGRSVLCLLIATQVSIGVADPLDDQIAVIQKVQGEGEGNVEAGKAWAKLVEADANALVRVLEAMDGSNPLAANWLRGAVETIASRTIEKGGKLPIAELGEYLLDRSHNPRARRLAFDLIARVSKETAEKLVPGMLNDPSVELRRDAVQRLIDQGGALVKAEKKAEASILLRQALQAARDVKQVETIAKQLRGLDRPVDLPRHFGFLMNWKAIGPFDNTDRKGFAAAFPPEKGVDLKGTFEGKDEKVSWSDFGTKDEYGMVDVNQKYGELKGATAYLYTEFVSESDQPVELRLGCKNAWKIWLNGKFLFGRDEYHRGMRIDQYHVQGQMKKGHNTILIKLCQDEQTERWTKEWQVQIRVCDSTGTAILSADRGDARLANQNSNVTKGAE